MARFLLLVVVAVMLAASPARAQQPAADAGVVPSPEEQEQQREEKHEQPPDVQEPAIAPGEDTPPPVEEPPETAEAPAEPALCALESGEQGAVHPTTQWADGTALAGFDRENVAYVTVHFDTGFLAHFHVNWLAPVKIRQMLFGGRQRMLVYDDMDPSEKVRVYDKGVNLDVVDDQTRRQILVSYRTGDMYAPKLDRREALTLVAREFADAIAERRTPLTGAAAGIRVVSLLEAAERSLRSEGSRIRM